MRQRPGLLRPLARLAAAFVVGGSIERLRPGDERICARVASQRRPMLDEWLPVLTDLGSMYAVAGAAGALALGGKRKLARDVLGAGTLAWVLAQGSKRAFNRSRPYDDGIGEMLVRKPAGTSYPSGHPAVAQAVAGIVAPEVPASLRGLVDAVPRMVGFSRIYVGVHYPSDVLGGMLIGKAVADLWRRFAK